MLLRFAYDQGYDDAGALAEAFDWESETEWLTAGPLLQAFEGVARIEAEEISFDRDSGDFLWRGVWSNSYEAEEQLKQAGSGPSAVCWLLTGYSSGYASRFFGRDLLAIETTCVGQGDNECRFEVRPVEEWGPAAELYLRAFEETAGLNEATAPQDGPDTFRSQLAGFETVAEVATIVSSVLETDQLLKTVVELTKERFGLYHTHIYLLDEAGTALGLVAGAGDIGQQMIDEGWTIGLDREQSLVARAAQERRGIMVNDVRADPGFFQNPLLPDTRSELAVPIIAADRLLGVLDVQSDAVDDFSEIDIRIMTTLASQVGSAIRNARLFETVVLAQKEAESRLQETETLQKLSESLAGTLQLSEIIEAFFQACTKLLGFDFAIFGLVDQHQRRIKAVAGLNVTDDRIRQADQPLDSEDILAGVIKTGRAEIIQGRDQRPDGEISAAEDMLVAGLRVLMPITLRYENIGLVEVGFKENLEATVQESQLRLLRIFIDQTALAIESAQRYETSQKEARREQILREVTARIRGAADVDTVMRMAAQEVGRALGRQAFMYLGDRNGGDKVQLAEDEKDA
jgi:GAF domain-containing protein